VRLEQFDLFRVYEVPYEVAFRQARKDRTFLTAVRYFHSPLVDQQPRVALTVSQDVVALDDLGREDRLYSGRPGLVFTVLVDVDESRPLAFRIDVPMTRAPSQPAARVARALQPPATAQRSRPPATHQPVHNL
jgi:hypothetical protein